MLTGSSRLRPRGAMFIMYNISVYVWCSLLGSVLHGGRKGSYGRGGAWRGRYRSAAGPFLGILFSCHITTKIES